jgi:hypothetical protein
MMILIGLRHAVASKTKHIAGGDSRREVRRTMSLDVHIQNKWHWILHATFVTITQELPALVHKYLPNATPAAMQPNLMDPERGWVLEIHALLHPFLKMQI